MEARKIMIMSTKTQKRTTIMSEAETLGQLKAELSAAGIDYTNMTFYEGTSKTELLTDDSILPHDVPYKGTVTNNLVFMLTNTDKHIASGMDRAAAYEAIRNLGLQQVVKDTFGDNFTRVSTANLEKVIADYETSLYEAKQAEECNAEHCTCGCANVRKALVELINILYSNAFILDKEYNNLMDMLEEAPAEEELYSEQELQDMFHFFN